MNALEQALSTMVDQIKVRLADKYKEINTLKAQLVDKVILEDPMKSK